MAWEWVTAVDEFTGNYATCEISWDTVLNAIINEDVINPVNGTSMTGGSGDYYWSQNESNPKTVSTTYGLSVVYTVQNWENFYFEVKYNNVQIVSYSTTGTQGASFRFAINHDTQEATFGVIFLYYSKTKGGYQGGFDYNARHQLYQILTGHMPPEYVWHSVGSISGKLGVFNLAGINDEDIGDGSYISGADYSVIAGLSESARLNNIVANMSIGETRDICYSGDVFKMTGEFGSGWFRLSFYLMPTTPGTAPPVFYSYQFSTTVPRSTIYIGFIIDDENEVAALNLISVLVDQQTGTKTVSYCYPGTSMTAEEMHLMWGWIKGSFTDNDALDSFVDNDGDGGGDLINRINNPIPKPGVPNLSAFDTGFISQYKIGKGDLNSLASFLWSDSFVNAVKRFFNDPMEILIGLKIFPLEPEHLGSSREIVGGGIGTGVNGTPLTSQFSRYDFGTCVIEKRLKSADYPESGIYFDYSPFTEVSVYIPYCGEHSLDVNDVMGKTLHLYYTVDHLSGGCVASLVIEDPDDTSAPEECHYNFSGQMGIDCPVSQADYRAKYSAMISTGIVAGTAIATVATGGLTAPLTGAAAAAAGVESGTNKVDPGATIGLSSRTASRLANNVANMHPTVQHTSGGGEVTGSLSSEYPYVMISEPDVFDAKNQKHYKGYPVNGTYEIGDFNGYVQIDSVHLDGLTCTENERNSIRQALMAGVIVNKTDPSETPDSSAPAGQLGIVFLKNVSDPDTIGKHWSASSKVTGKLFYDQDIETPKVQIDGSLATYSQYNYCYIGDLGRYYYISSFHIDTGTLFTVELDCDPLQSFKDEILNIPALIDSAEDKDKAKFLMNNGYWFMKQKKNIKTLTFKKSGVTQKFDRSSEGPECFLLTIAGDYSSS